ncbi:MULTISPECIES: hypothetical protein [Okeania]|uniref:hypothetical protein n=1 Tax=Okeania TaxID=1458928 RepID=UPI001374DEE3|nr:MULTISPECIES: hypothetical protein [Okeania]NET11475.1 hypothetical protein [Okeania sp. SIO1H6]NET18336.1 hypothetical protein [Okeania sp. SIO1H5]NET75946.1 hypothetical protein [Okeania sp. SIO1F9]NET92195.1 hypothetical protein [Okeania sp. SIO1H2]
MNLVSKLLVIDVIFIGHLAFKAVKYYEPNYKVDVFSRIVYRNKVWEKSQESSDRK